MVCGGTSSDAGVAWAVSVWTEHVEASDQAHLSALVVPCLTVWSPIDCVIITSPCLGTTPFYGKLRTL